MTDILSKKGYEHHYTEWYIENRIADYVNRIVTAERLKELHTEHGKLLEAKHVQKTIDKLEKELYDFKLSLGLKVEEMPEDDISDSQK